jgi:hypothetical protein
VKEKTKMMSLEERLETASRTEANEAVCHRHVHFYLMYVWCTFIQRRRLVLWLQNLQICGEPAIDVRGINAADTN